MWPFFVKLGPLALTPNELFTVLGVVACGIVLRRRLVELGSSPVGVLDFALAALFGGALGARLYYFLPLWFRGQMSIGQLFSTWSQGSGFYGGYIGGAIAVAITARVKRMPLLKTFDACLGVIPLGFAIGKIGCFLAGCCYGMPSDSGVCFAAGSLCYMTQIREGTLKPGAAASNPVVPVPLFDMVFGFSLYAATIWVGRRARRPGVAGAFSAACYSAYRFGIEFFRNDPDRHTFGSSSLTDSQFTAVAVFLAAAGWGIWLLRKPAENGAPAPK